MANLSFIEEARAQLKEHLCFLGESDFEPEDEFYEAAGLPVCEPDEKARPFYFSVINTAVIPAYTPVVLFNAAVNLTTFNYGNPPNIQIVSLYPNTTYGGLLTVSIDQPFRVSRIKIFSQDTDPLSQPIAFTEIKYTGDADTISYVPNIPLDQVYTPNNGTRAGVVAIEMDEIIHSSRQISFQLLSNNYVSYKIFPKYIHDYARVLQHKKIMRTFQNPRPYTLPTPPKIVVVNNTL